MRAEETVLIVGAGPTGLSAANFLHAQGIAVEVVDVARGPAQESRALAIHARTLELLHPHGLSAPLIEAGLRIERMVLTSDEERLGALEIAAEVGRWSRHDFMLSLPQRDTERSLRARLEEAGVSVSWQTRLSTLRQHDQGVEVVLEDAQQRLRVAQYAYVLGCDGARSTTREALGVAAEGVRRPAWVALADVVLDQTLAPEVLASVSTEGAGLLIPLPEPRTARLVFPLERTSSDRPELTVAELQAMIDQRLPFHALQVVETSWLSAFHIHERLAERYQEGRVFLLGDAAHTHSPLGGQGMNTGIQDAANLAWKLALVMRGHAPESLLEHYALERRPVGERLVARTSLGTDVAFSTSPAVSWLREHLAPALLERAFVQRKAASLVSMLGIDYRTSDLTWGSVGVHGVSVAGDRAPDPEGLDADDAPVRLLDLHDGVRHTALLFGAPTDGRDVLYRNMMERLGADAQVFWVARPGERPGARWPGGAVLDHQGHWHEAFGMDARDEALVCVIRPDGYIGFRDTSPSLKRLDWWIGHWRY